MVVETGVLDVWGVVAAGDTMTTAATGEPFLSSGVAGLRGSLTLSRGAGEDVRWSILAGVLARFGRLLGVDGLPFADVGLGEAAGLGEAVLPLGVAGDEGRCLDKGLGLGSGLCLILGRDCLFLRTFSLLRALFSFSFCRSFSFFSFLFLSIGVELRLCCLWVMSGVLDVTLQRSEQRWWGWWEHMVRGLAEDERGQTGECPSLPLMRTLAALRLLARNESVGVISRSTILLSHGVSARPRVSFWLEFWLRAPVQDHLCCRISAHVFFPDRLIAA